MVKLGGVVFVKMALIEPSPFFFLFFTLHEYPVSLKLSNDPFNSVL